MKAFITTLVLVPSLILAENLFKNSDMNTSAAWKGDKTYTELESNRVIQLKANSNRVSSFSQDTDAKDIKDLTLKFRYKTSDYKGRGLQLKGERVNGSSTFRTIELKADGQWHEYTWPFTEIRGSSKVDFIFNLWEGEGTVYFDDISLEAKK